MSECKPATTASGNDADDEGSNWSEESFEFTSLVDLRAWLNGFDIVSLQKISITGEAIGVAFLKEVSAGIETQTVRVWGFPEED